MDKQVKNTHRVNNPLKKVIITLVIIVIIILGWAGLTKAGYIPNYLGFSYLCHEEPNDYFIPSCGGKRGMSYKPIIYLYPEKEELINVKLNYQGNLTVTYPRYNNGWNVVASPNGKLINQSDNKEYSYLFWEGQNYFADYDLSTGFVVKGSSTETFLKENLAKFGLKPKEYNEFMVYWLPQMINNEYNLIHFATKEEYADRAVLDINPQPDSVLRVFMVFQKLDREIKVKPQQIQPWERTGFSVVEWGGTEVK